jgi:hypothetical protein
MFSRNSANLSKRIIITLFSQVYTLSRRIPIVLGTRLHCAIHDEADHQAVVGDEVAKHESCLQWNY